MTLMNQIEMSPPPAAERLPIESPDIFRADEAWRYLKLPSKRSLDDNRRRLKETMHLSFGRRFGRKGYLYSREELESMRLILFGLDRPDPVKPRPSRGASR